MSRTPIVAALRRAADIAALARGRGAPPIAELAAIPRPKVSAAIPRRALLVGAALAPFAARAQAPLRNARIAVVGGGLAGLVAAHRLVESGARDITLYEANRRLGGRMLSGRGVVGEGTLVELGGSFINSEHTDVLDLAREFGLGLEDSFGDPGASRIHVGGALRSIADVATEAAPFLAHLAALRDTPKAAQDARSAQAVMDGFGVSGWLRRLLDIGLTQEMGREPGAMSALYLIEYFTPDPARPRRGLFASDQRYQIQGGNDRLPAAIAAKLGARINTGRRLEAVRSRGQGYALALGGREVVADIVVLTLPVTILRQVELAVPLPPLTRRAIRDLAYGTNAKMFAGFAARPWREAGLSGETINDFGQQACWEDHGARGAGPGALTIFAGGTVGRGFGTGDVAQRVRQAVAGLEPALPGAGAAYSGRAQRMMWPQNPYVGGSYACFGPGQYAGFEGAWASAGRVVFAGEHTSEAYSGYMNGAAESGRAAAERVLGWLRQG